MADHRTRRHIPNTELAVRALDGDRTVWSASHVRHLSLCRACRDRLTAYRRVVEAGRLTRPGQTVQEPSARVWTGIRTRLALDRPSARPAGRSPTRPTARPRLPLLRRLGRHALRRPATVVRAFPRRLTRLARLLFGRPGDPRP